MKIRFHADLSQNLVIQQFDHADHESVILFELQPLHGAEFLLEVEICLSLNRAPLAHVFAFTNTHSRKETPRVVQSFRRVYSRQRVGYTFD